MQTNRMRTAIAFVALCLSAPTVQAQVLQPSAVSARSVVERDSSGSASRALMADAPPRRGLRARPIVIGAMVGALLGAGGGALLAGMCDSQYCSSRDEVIKGTWLGAAIGGLFGLVLALPPKDH